MTVVTASGRVELGRHGLCAGRRCRAGRGPGARGPLRLELERVLTVADRANNAVLQERNGRWTVQGDPTEGALVVAARKAGLNGDALGRRFARVGEIPFSSARKLMSTVHTDADRDNGCASSPRGPLNVLLTRCSHELVR